MSLDFSYLPSDLFQASIQYSSEEKKFNTNLSYKWHCFDFVCVYTVKKMYKIPGFVLTKPSRDWDCVNYSRPGRVWYVTFRLGTGIPLNLFFSVQGYRLPFCLEFFVYYEMNVKPEAKGRRRFHIPNIVQFQGRSSHK